MDGIQFSNNINTSSLVKKKTSLSIVDDIFGGGISFPSMFMIYGRPGTGKTTFLCQVCGALQYLSIPSLAAIGEMKLQLSAKLCKSLNVNILLTENMDIDFLCEQTKFFKFMFVDSLQMLIYNREKHFFKNDQAFRLNCIERLYDAAYTNNCCVGIVIHSTKNGTYKGSSFISHMIDTEIKMENTDENNIKIISTVKNRMGPLTSVQIKRANNGFILNKQNWWSCIL